MTTLELFDEIIGECQTVFIKKNKDYGASWKILRLSSITDQVLIKAARIRSIEEKKNQAVDDPIEEDYMGIINYSIMGILQLQYLQLKNIDYSFDRINEDYKNIVTTIRKLLECKNSDYGEIWRKMKISSYTDLILMKLERLHQIHENGGEVQFSEGIDSHYMDIVNYSIFALIKLSEQKK